MVIPWTTGGKRVISQRHTLSPPSCWVETYGDYLYSFALNKIQNEFAAQDLVQETLVAALASKNSFKGKSSEKTWLTGILKHKIIDLMRKKIRESGFEDDLIDSRMLESRFDHQGQWKSGPEEWGDNPESLLEQKSFLDIVKQCLMTLPVKPASVLALKEFEGETTGSICSLLGISTTNCWVILHRARALMRDCIEIKWLGKRG